MAWTLDDILPAILNAKEAGLAVGKMKKNLPGKLQGELAGRLKAWVAGGAIRGPMKAGNSQLYFATGFGPSVETTSDIVARLVHEAGTRLSSKTGLRGKIPGLYKPYFDDAVRHAVASRVLLELSFGTSRYVLHRDVARDCFGLAEPGGAASPVRPAPTQDLALADLRPVYRRLVAEQGGFSTVKIFDLIKALGVDKDVLHRLLLAEAKAGRLTIHPTTSVELPREVVEAGLRLPGHDDPYVTVVIPDVA